MNHLPDTRILSVLTSMDARLDRGLDELHDIKARVTALVETMAGVHRRIDRRSERLQHIERRLDPTCATH